MGKLGVIIQYYHLREDIPKLLDTLSADWEIVLFARPEDAASIQSVYEVREIPQSRTLWNRIWSAMYEAAGNTPGRFANFKFWNQRRIAHQRNLGRRMRLRAMLQLRRFFANWISFDQYLAQLQVDISARIDDIDALLGMTDVYDVNFLQHVISAGKPVYLYVYSWDHAAKYHKFSKKHVHYFTWNRGISDDLRDLHSIPQGSINEVGSTQLALVDQFLHSDADHVRIVPHRYAYYAGTMAYPEAIEQEISVVRWLASVLARIDPDVRLLIRPYPNAKAFEPYRTLLAIKNVEIENVSITPNSVVFHRDTLQEKYSKIRDAELFIHMGSTIGLEAAYLGTPIIHLAPEDFDYGRPPSDPCHLLHTLHQRHLSRYMLSSNEPNVIRKMAQLSSTLKTSLESPGQLLKYNEALANLTPLQSMSETASAMTALMDTSAARVAVAQ